MVGVICPSIFEYNALNKARLRRSGAVLVKSGMGKLRAMRACAELHRLYPGLKHIILIGFAGGLTSGLKIGDIIEPRVFIEQDYFAEPFERFPNTIRKNGSKRFIPGSKEAVILTQDRFLTENPYKNGPYAKKFKAVACDMESYAVAFYCKGASIPYSVVKLISDAADETADHDFLKACRMLAPKLDRTVRTAVSRILRT